MTSPRCDRRLPGRRDSCGAVLLEELDSIGRLQYRCARCEAQQAGRCWQCGLPREKRDPRAVYCASCRAARRRQSSRQQEASPDRQNRRRIMDRRRNKTAQRQAWRQAWRAANSDKIKRYKRREALNPTPRRREREAWWNAQPERAAKKREQAKAAYYAKHPKRPQPVCRVCHATIPFVPPGRPKTRCDGCVPASVLAKRRPAPMAVAA